jgi:hypothetical protein
MRITAERSIPVLWGSFRKNISNFHNRNVPPRLIRIGIPSLSKAICRIIGDSVILWEKRKMIGNMANENG